MKKKIVLQDPLRIRIIRATINNNMKKKIPVQFLDQLRDIQDSVYELSERVDAIFDEYEVPVKIQEIKKYIQENKNVQISTSWLQRRYRIGYARAATLIDKLRKEKIVR
jgi:DNA segregation ATPase FtsK/SpoIIIE-like protein